MAAELSNSQRAALHFVTTYARGRKMNAQHTIAGIPFHNPNMTKLYE